MQISENGGVFSHDGKFITDKPYVDGEITNHIEQDGNGAPVTLPAPEFQHWAKAIHVIDAGAFFGANNLEDILQEIGPGPTVDSTNFNLPGNCCSTQSPSATTTSYTGALLATVGGSAQFGGDCHAGADPANCRVTLSTSTGSIFLDYFGSEGGIFTYNLTKTHVTGVVTISFSSVPSGPTYACNISGVIDVIVG